MSWWWWCRFARRQDLAGFGAGWDSLAEALPHWGVSLVVTGDLFSVLFVEMVNSARDPFWNETEALRSDMLVWVGKLQIDW